MQRFEHHGRHPGAARLTAAEQGLEGGDVVVGEVLESLHHGLKALVVFGLAGRRDGGEGASVEAGLGGENDWRLSAGAADGFSTGFTGGAALISYAGISGGFAGFSTAGLAGGSGFVSAGKLGGNSTLGSSLGASVAFGAGGFSDKAGFGSSGATGGLTGDAVRGGSDPFDPTGGFS